jgi:hypothetical protein
MSGKRQRERGPDIDYETEQDMIKELGFGRDCYKNDEDRNELEQMKPLLRESEMAERY